MRHERVELAARSGVQARQDIFKPETKIDIIGLAGFRKGKDNSKVLTALFAGGE